MYVKYSTMCLVYRKESMKRGFGRRHCHHHQILNGKTSVWGMPLPLKCRAWPSVCLPEGDCFWILTWRLVTSSPQPCASPPSPQPRPVWGASDLVSAWLTLKALGTGGRIAGTGRGNSLPGEALLQHGPWFPRNCRQEPVRRGRQEWYSLGNQQAARGQPSCGQTGVKEVWRVWGT